MENNINALATARDEAGSKVEELQNKRNEMAVKMVADPDAFSDEEINKISNELKQAVKVRDFAQKALDEERTNLKTPSPVGGDNPGKSEKAVAFEKAKKITNQFVSDFKNMVTSKVLPEGSETEGPNAGLTIPVDVQTAINTLKRSFTSLEGLVNVENVSVPSGSRVYEKLSDVTPFDNLDDETAEIGDNDDPKLTIVKYVIHRYAGISTITNTLLKDSAENILAWIENWIAKKDVITRNEQILTLLNNGKANKIPKKVSITDFDGIKDLENNTLDPLIEATSSFITNQSGFNVLSKVKDAEGRYLIQPDPTKPDTKQIEGYVVNVIADKFLPDINGDHPLYFGDYKMAITLFDYQRMTLMTTKEGAGAFERDLTKIRVIDRFDVELIDEGAYAIGTFNTVKDQTSNVIASNGTTGTKSIDEDGTMTKLANAVDKLTENLNGKESEDTSDSSKSTDSKAKSSGK